MKLLLTIILLLVSTSKLFGQTNNDWAFECDPANGHISGSPGQTIGWGYKFTNLTSQYWLAIDVPTVSNVINNSIINYSIFDFPLIPPSQSVTVSYNGQVGLIEIQWDSSAPVGYIASGALIAEASWYDSDPTIGGNLISTPTQTKNVPFQASVIAASSAPEPTSAVLFATPLATITAINGLKKKLKKDKKKG